MVEPITDELSAGTVIDGRYQITGALGEGGFATVYRATQTNIDREVAIKVLEIPRTLKNKDEFKARFKREAGLAAKIKHDGVVTIHDYGLFGRKNRPYMVMELLVGHDLEDEIKNQTLEPARAVRLIIQALDALGAAHRVGIVHKDLKPANLFLVHPNTTDETLKLVDFGVARIDDESKFTSTGQLVGTPQYLAPEYIETGAVTPALDVYQMGLILVEAMTGRAVVNANNSLKCILLHSTGALEVPTAITSSPLGPILIKALDLDPDARYPNASAFRAALLALDLGALPHLDLSQPDLNHSIKTGSQWLDAPKNLNAKPAANVGLAETKARTKPAIQNPDLALGQTREASPAQSVEPAEAKAPSKAPLWVAIALIVLVLGVGVALTITAEPNTATPPPTQALSNKPETKPDPAPIKTEPVKTEAPAPELAPSPEAVAPPAKPWQALADAHIPEHLRETLSQAQTAFAKRLYPDTLSALEPLLADNPMGHTQFETLALPLRRTVFTLLLVSWSSLETAPKDLEVFATRALRQLPGFNIQADDHGANAKQAQTLLSTIESQSSPSPAHHVTLRSTPDGATVNLGKQTVGLTPLTLSFDAEDTPAKTLTLKLTGYQTLKLPVGPSDKAHDLVLVENNTSAKQRRRTNTSRRSKETPKRPVPKKRPKRPTLKKRPKKAPKACEQKANCESTTPPRHRTRHRLLPFVRPRCPRSRHAR